MILFTAVSCQEDSVPRPFGQLRLEYPGAEYKTVQPDGCPFSFEVNRLVQVEKGKKNCYFNLIYPNMKAKIFLGYEPVIGDLSGLAGEAENLVYKHTIKASAIDASSFSFPENKVFGSFYKLEGKAASNIQFYATDSTAHFLNGSLYFKTRPNPDSLAPAVDYVEKDIRHMLETLKWH